MIFQYLGMGDRRQSTGTIDNVSTIDEGCICSIPGIMHGIAQAISIMQGL